MADISLSGAQLSVDIQVQLSPGDILRSLSFTLYSRLLADHEEGVTLPEAKIVWLKNEKERILKIGIQFEPNETAHEALTNYIYLRSIEDPKMMAE